MAEYIKMVSDNGISLIILGLVTYILWCLAKSFPEFLRAKIKSIQNHDKNSQKWEAVRAEKYDQQMEILVTVTQQGLESQKKSAQVIENNNKVLGEVLTAERELVKTVGSFSLEVIKLQGTLSSMQEYQTKTLDATLRIDERCQLCNRRVYDKDKEERA